MYMHLVKEKVNSSSVSIRYFQRERKHKLLQSGGLIRECAVVVFVSVLSTYEEIK